MADHKVQDLDRVTEEEPLSSVLSVLKDDSDPFLMYQASYAFQALQYVPNNETSFQAVVRYSTGLAESLIKISSLAKLDLEKPLEGFREIQGMMTEAVDAGKSAYKGTLSLMESGKGLLDSVRKGLGSGHKQPWYFAVRSANALVREGRLADLSSLIRDASCRRDPFFQWGISQILADIAVGSEWDSNIRQRSLDILDDLFRNDPDWNRDPSVREWMRALFTLIASETDLAIQEGPHRLIDGSTNDVDASQSIAYLLSARLPAPRSSLLARVLEIPPVEYKLRCLKDQRLKLRHQVYVKPQAKMTLQLNDKDWFPLEENVRGFLHSKREVMLLLGDSGSGKSTFGSYFELELWNEYKEGGSIPLFINLPSIDNPQKNMIAKQLEIYEFTEEEVQELRRSRRNFILICDGYDESQKKTNLHWTNQLNQDGQWSAKMIISCRSQHVKAGTDYQEWFRPKGQGDRYKSALTPGLDLFQEAVIAPFTREQIKDYVEQYVKSDDNNTTSSKPLDWTTNDYVDRLAGNRDLSDLVSNPFLLSLALVALPGLVTTKEELRNVHVSRVKLYDTFVEKWLKCGRRRLAESKLSEAEWVVFEKLEEEFVPEAMEYLKGLSTAIFENQAGKPVVTFDEGKNSDVWQRKFFGPDEKIRLLRVSCPLIPSGKNKHRFLHRSLLEYFYSRTFSDPKDPEAETDVDDDEPPTPPTFAKVRESIADHPLRLQSISDQPLVIQFLAERAQVDIFFKQQLLAMVESLDVDTQSVQAAVQAVEILMMARIRFNGFNLSGMKALQNDRDFIPSAVKKTTLR
ncbi:Transducin (beta)-like 1 X-linked receptor 1 [Linnemannia gamsii]|uniref:Transducin (Beta)-like 1 X-linked receptor 1 n=1 Tax=Linnemannia gamsii TaxID=64522 RepID=A0ABQ7KC42_9FUNG|nr:Transducin (beta)-like 1 X-linked receptor 1 [Linnemannia gamsii]